MVKKLVIISLFFSFASVIPSALVNRANATVYTWSAAADGNWSTTTNWTPNGTPGASDTVTFDGTSVKNCTRSAPVTVAGMTITAAYSGTIAQSTNDITVSGDFSMAGGTFDINANLSVGGNFSITGGITNYWWGVILTGTGTYTATIDGTWIKYFLTCGAAGKTTTLTGSISSGANTSVTVGSGTLDLNNIYGLEIRGPSSLTVNGGRINNGTVKFTTINTATIPSATYSTLLVYPNGNPTYKCVLGGNVICTGDLKIGNGVAAVGLDTNGYSITAANILTGRDVDGNEGSTGNMLKCNGSTITTTGNVTIPVGSIVDADSSHWYVGDGTFSNSGTFNAGTSTLEFTGNSSVSSAGNLYNLIIGGSGKTTTLSSNVTVANDLTIGSGATLTAGSNTLTVNGNLTNSGTLSTPSFTVLAGKTALMNAGSVWNITNGKTLTVQGTLKSTGTSTNMTTVQSSSSSGYFGLAATDGGKVDLTGCKLYYLNKDGLTINSTGNITKMDNVELKYGESGGTHLKVLNGQSITITNMVFDDIANGGTNITVKNNSKIKVNKYRRGKNRDSIESGSNVIWGIEQSINPVEGGRIVSNDDPLTYIDIPANSQKREMTFALGQLQEWELPLSSQPATVVRAYTLEAVDKDGKQVKILDGPITLVIHTSTNGTDVLDSGGLTTGIKVSEASNRLSMGYWNERYWVKLGGRIDKSNNDNDVTISTKVSHLSKYAIVTKEATQSIAINVSPNPFTPASSDSRFNRVNFSFNNENNEEVELKIWDLTAGLVRTIREYGTSSISWDGRNEYGEIVEGGVYIWQLKVGKDVAGKGTVVVAK